MQEVALGVLAGLWAGGVQHAGVPAAIWQLSAGAATFAQPANHCSQERMKQLHAVEAQCPLPCSNTFCFRLYVTQHCRQEHVKQLDAIKARRDALASDVAQKRSMGGWRGGAGRGIGRRAAEVGRMHHEQPPRRQVLPVNVLGSAGAAAGGTLGHASCRRQVLGHCCPPGLLVPIFL